MSPGSAGRRAWVIVAALALLASLPGITNGFVFDDVPIVLENSLLHRLEDAPRIWRSSYWPTGALYRPLTMQLFSLQWALGQGNPLVFHTTNIVLTIALSIGFFVLVRRLLPPLAALLAAAWFAVHPVHVESVGNVIGQGELLATLMAVVAVERYIHWRSAGALSGRQRVALAVLTLAAILSKETGVMIPALLLAVELSPPRPRRAPVSELGPTFYLQAAAVLAAVLLRISAVGPTPAAGPSVALKDLATSDRIIGMLAVVPHWLRLLVWPAHLQAEYGPPALAITGTIGWTHVLGVIVITAAVGAMVIVWRRAPAVGLGFAWVAIALFPVSNVLTTTGVVLAERTLMLPSAGAMLALGGLFAGVLARLERHTVGRGLALAVGGLLVLAGAARSMERQLVWRSQSVFFEQIQVDAPRTYRAHLVASEYYAHDGRLDAAERAARRGLELFRGDPKLYEHLGQVLRRQKRCAEARPILAEGTSRFPDRTTLRARYIECTLAIGDTVGARRIAREAVDQGYTEFEQTLRRLDSHP